MHFMRVSRGSMTVVHEATAGGDVGVREPALVLLDQFFALGFGVSRRLDLAAKDDVCRGIGASEAISAPGHRGSRLRAGAWSPSRVGAAEVLAEDDRHRGTVASA